ncbi:MAG: YjbF family lipoprotein [Rubellimicrobium sp.]|nr:YjbF family lipoprotein [Rubellimicrobium sp.]
MRARTISAVALVAALSACGADTGDSIWMRLFQSLRPGGGTAAAGVPMETPGFTARLIAERPQDFMIVDVPTIGLNQPARILQANGVEQTWQAQGGATYALDDGILVATRGLIDDLLVISSEGVRPALAAGGGTVTRTIESLDSLDRLSTATVTCTITRDGPETVNLGLREADLVKFTEHCASPALVFDNAYWLDGAGMIMASRQFVSVGVGYLRSNRL